MKKFAPNSDKCLMMKITTMNVVDFSNKLFAKTGEKRTLKNPPLFIQYGDYRVKNSAKPLSRRVLLNS